MQKDFKQFFIEKAGKSQIKEGEFQDISDAESSKKSSKDIAQDDQLKVESEDQSEGGIKTMQFWSSIPAISNASKPQKQPVQWQINCPLSFGFNSLGRDNILYIDGLICKAVGCMLIYNNRIYDQHHHKITTLSYNQSLRQLLSATDSATPELYLWNYDPDCQDLEFVRKFFIGRKCEEIYAVSFFREDYVVAVEKFTLHKSSNLHFFNKNSEDSKDKSIVKIGKFYDLETLLPYQESKDAINQQRLFYANDEGIFELKIDDSEEKPSLTCQKILTSDNLTCLCPFYNCSSEDLLEILYGDKQGNISLVRTKKTIKFHEGWIFEIKTRKQKDANYFFTLGAIDSNLAVIEMKNNNLSILHKIFLGGYGRSIETENDLLLIGKRDGDFQQFSISQLVTQKKTAKIPRKQSQSLKCFESKSKSNKFLLKCNEYRKIQKEKQKKKQSKQEKEQNKKVNYVYANDCSKNAQFFTIQQNQIKNIENYALRTYPQTFDTAQNLIAYTYDVFSKEDENLKSKTLSQTKSKIMKKTKEESFEKSILVVENFTNKTLISKFSLKVGQSKQESSFEVKFTTIKFSPSGKLLALGNTEGNIYVVQIVQSQKQTLKLIKASTQNHKQPIKQIIWSKDQKYIKSVSVSEVYYWKVQKSKNSKAMEIQFVKPQQVKQTGWTGLGKFGWEVKSVWESIGFVQDISYFWDMQSTKAEKIYKNTGVQITVQKNKIIGCALNDGKVKIYNYPAHSSKYQTIKCHDSVVQVCDFVHSIDKFSFWIVIEGILVLIELTD